MEGVFVEVAELIALILLGVRAVQLRRRLDEANKKIDARTQIAKDLYERSRRQINEHIKAPIHGR